MTQTDIFGYLYPDYKITKPIRLIELFAGVGTQAMALRDLGVKFERWKTCEWDYHAILSYAAIHCADDKNDYSSALDDLDLANSLYQLGISADGKSQMELASIKRLLEKKKRKIYNAIMASHNMVNIISATADDLKITDTDRYEYIMTYSFPCQDLSLAGRGKGMEKGSGTRSSLLWEVERILLELKERNELPQVLVMENVPEVIGTKNYPHFMKWYSSLEQMGYQSYYKLLNAKDYGEPQSRNRCFMISILGNYNYTFPSPVPLKRRLRDVLESELDERYYLSDKATAYLFDDKDRGGMVRVKRVRLKNEDSTLANTVTTMQRGYSPFDNLIICDQRIRKLTPLECWRLMDYSDEDFYKAQAVSSNTQLYKQAGNGIVRAVLMAVFKEMLGKE